MKSQCIFGEYTYSPPGFVDQENFGEERKGEWRAETTDYTGMVPATHLGTNNYSQAAKEVRDSFKRYFSSNEGMVSWQLDYVTRTWTHLIMWTWAHKNCFIIAPLFMK